MAANKKTYRVKTYILHDGQELADGDDVDLTNAQARQALESGAVVEIETPKPAAADKK